MIDLGIDVNFASKERFKGRGTILFGRINRLNVQACAILADDALWVKPNTPEAATGKDGLADNHLAQTLAGKVANVPVERCCIGAVALNRVYNVDLKESVTSNGDSKQGGQRKHSPLQRSCQSAGRGLLLLWIPAFLRRLHRPPDASLPPTNGLIFHLGFVGGRKAERSAGGSSSTGDILEQALLLRLLPGFLPGERKMNRDNNTGNQY